MMHVEFLKMSLYAKRLYILEYGCLPLHLPMIERFGIPLSIVSLPAL